MTNHLNDLGFTPQLLEQWHGQGQPGRISGETHGLFRILTADGEITGRLPGRTARALVGTLDHPVTGDFVLVDEDNMIRDIAPRTSLMTRGDSFSASLTEGLVANCDYVFVVISLNQDFHERKIRRFLIMAASSDSTPVLILTKADLNSSAENEAYLSAARELWPGTILVTRQDETGSYQPILDLLRGGKTGALLGASGVGKSTLINHLLGYERMKVSGIRNSDDQGRHTPTHREIILIPGFGCLIDTPGLRRIDLIDDGQAVEAVYGNIATWMKQCRFTDCSHTTEPGCAVQAAIQRGDLTEAELEDFRTMQKEAMLYERKMRQREKERIKRTTHQKTAKPRQRSWNEQEL